MSAWPETMNVGPVRKWPGALTVARKVSAFSATLTDTLRVLDREIYHLAETRAHQNSAELLLAIPAEQFRLDGRPRATAKAVHPGVIFSMETPHGRLSYPCDTFTTWQDNLRAIVLALEALRKVDRYGVTKRGEQYRGFLELEATAAPAGFASLDEATAWLYRFIEPHSIAGGNLSLRDVLRRAQRIAHPDQGGDSAAFRRVSLAESKLREAGQL